MKKILIILIAVVLLYLLYNTIVNGMEIGDLKILSYQEIQNANSDLDKKVSDLDSLIKDDYAKSKAEVESAKTDFKMKKQAYD